MMEIRRIPLEGLPNTRDLGGFPAADGKKIRPHRLLRSGELKNLTRQDQKILTEEYALRTVVDFRTATECSERPDPEIAGVTRYHLQILDEDTLGLTREKKTEEETLFGLLKSMEQDGLTAAGYMERMYAGFLDSRFAREQYRKFMELLLAQEEGAVLWHCTAGKDRAGVGTMLVLEALGVDREIILEDYTKVNDFTEKVLEAQGEALLRKGIPAPAVAALREIFQVKRSYLESLYGQIEKRYGSMGRFLEQEMRLDEAALAVLRQNYLEN